MTRRPLILQLIQSKAGVNGVGGNGRGRGGEGRGGEGEGEGKGRGGKGGEGRQGKGRGGGNTLIQCDIAWNTTDDVLDV